MCRKFNDIWYTTKFKGYTVADYQENVAPVMTPEKKLLYQVFCVLETHCEKGRCQPSTEYVLSAKKDLSIDLKRQVLENAMKAPPPTLVRPTRSPSRRSEQCSRRKRRGTKTTMLTRTRQLRRKHNHRKKRR